MSVTVIRSRFLHAALFSLLLVGAACGQKPAIAPPEKAAAAFYEVYLHLSPRVGGVPDQAMRAKFAPVISTRLEKLLADAETAETRHREATQNSEPPFVEGDPFTSLFEGASSFKIGTCTIREEVAQCPVNLTYVDPAGGKPANWTDTAVLVLQDQAWVVDDIVYGGQWDFATRGRLQTLLENDIGQLVDR